MRCTPSTTTGSPPSASAPPVPIPSTPPSIDALAAERLRALLHRSPRDFGHPTSRCWTLDLAAETAFAAGITPTRVSGETVHATLVRLGIRWRRAKTGYPDGVITSPDPAYAQKNSAATG